MPAPSLLLARLDQIAASLATRESALALLGLGSVGTDTHRLDEFSDLDFFAVVREGTKAGYLANLDWMEAAHPVAFAFQNTRDGHKLLFADGVFCEYAVFTPAEMADAHHPGGRIVWQRAEFDAALCVPKHRPAPQPAPDPQWVMGEALTNLYVGMSRYLRGERWNAMNFVQNYAVFRVADVLVREAGGAEPWRDPYGVDRRFESRHPEAAAALAPCMQGYERTPQSALAILAFFEARGGVNPAIAAAIRELCDRAIRER